MENHRGAGRPDLWVSAWSTDEGRLLSYVLSIDVGTTFTCAATWQDGRATTVTLGDRADAVPSVLFLRSEDEVLLVGEAAVHRAAADPTRVAREFKRRIGDKVPVVLGDQVFTPELLTGHIIRWVLDLTSTREGERPEHVTVTCPASWSGYRRDAMTQAAASAGLATVGLMGEPEAAATYYASRNRLAPGTAVAVYDFGGGTFDAAVLRKTPEGFVLLGKPDGDDDVGGLDLDAAVLQYVAAAAGISWADFDLTDPDVMAAVTQLRARVVEAKEALSADLTVDVPLILPGLHRRVRLTRSDFEELVDEYVHRTIAALERTVAGSGTRASELSAVLLVGGSSRVPMVARRVTEAFGVPALLDAHPKHSVCLGAAIGAAARIAPAHTPARARQRSTRPDPVRRLQPLPPDAEDGPATATAGFSAPTSPIRSEAARPAPSQPVTELVDLVGSGLTAPADSTTTVTATPHARFQVTSHDGPLEVRLDDADDDVGRYRRFAAFVVAAVVIVVLTALLSRLR